MDRFVPASRIRSCAIEIVCFAVKEIQDVVPSGFILPDCSR